MTIEEAKKMIDALVDKNNLTEDEEFELILAQKEFFVSGVIAYCNLDQIHSLSLLLQDQNTRCASECLSAVCRLSLPS